MDILGPINPFPRQENHIHVSIKLHFQATLRRYFGEERLALINASIEPFIFLAVIFCSLSLDVHIDIVHLQGEDSNLDDFYNCTILISFACFHESRSKYTTSKSTTWSIFPPI